jgi:integrase
MQCSDSLWVFPNQTGTRPYRIREAWENALKRAEIDNFKFHDLRHSAASYMLMNGASLAEIGEILGHKSFEMTKRYAHLSDNHARSIVERMNEAIFGQECDQ